MAQVPAALSFVRPWVGNQRILYNKAAIALEQKMPLFATINNVTITAPTMKWLLAIVPLTQAISGNPPVEKLDIKQSASLTFTGAVWAWYSLLIQPQNAGSRALCAVNVALFLSNGYNVWRKWTYDQAQKIKEAAA
eukprot:comp11825_c0_seq1/m.6451 comp11825_c0_seq1/g.6451  ORF comp11825_c0_seq1/g.6451 comp11825_c0_seq1/m.6451 type:complete len:136 (-) comp11825_c0_seq1:202-609(-)